MSDLFTILVHSSLLPVIRDSPSPVRSQLQKTLERLQFGYWGGGTRVKTLRGVRRALYEARVNADLRLLFTVARAPAARPPHAGERCLLLWDLLDHDRLGRPFRRNLVPEAGFLDFEELSAIELAEAPPDPETGTEAHERAADDLTESIRWFRIDPEIVLDEAEWQGLLDDSRSGDLELRLSLEQARVIHAPGPVLLRGTAGSGKTTVAVYRLAQAVTESPRARVLYVTYSPALLANAERLFDALFRARRLPPPARRPDFRTFGALYETLAGEAEEGAEIVRFPRFERWYRNSFRTGDAALAWEEIRGIVKGACLDPDVDALGRAEYEDLGRKRAPLFSAERPRLYRVFERFREWCRSKRRFDDIDLARRALRAQRGSAASRYDHVICDEGQDLTEIETLLLLELADHLGGLVFAADPQQIVNPSGFRWAEIRSLIWSRRKTAPEIHSLTRNFRSVQSVVGLANAFLGILRDRTGRSDDDDLQTTSLLGPSPVLVAGAEAGVVPHVEGFGPRCAVIARSTEEADRIGRSLESERVFDVFGAKGLEFDACVLWNLFSRDLDVWKELLLGHAPLREDPVARRAVHHVYVAVTRARRWLAVFEEDPAAAALWQSPALRPYLERDEPAALEKFMLAAASPEEWLAEAEYFLARERHRQAAECFRRGGDARREKLALAAFHRGVEEYASAAALYRELGQREDAAECFARAGRRREAAEEYAAAGRNERAAPLFEETGQWDRAAEAHALAGDPRAAARCRMRHHAGRKEWDLAAEAALSAGDDDAAADWMEKAGAADRARDLRLATARRRKDHRRVGEILEATGDLAEAEKAWKRAKDPRGAARCRALAAEAAGDVDGAIRRWRRLGDRDRVRRLEEERETARREALLRAARQAERAGDLESAATARLELGHDAKAMQLAARGAEERGDLLAAAEAWAEAGQTKDQLRCLTQSADPRARHWIEAIRARNEGRTLDCALELYRAERWAESERAAEEVLVDPSLKRLGYAAIPDEQFELRLSRLRTSRLVATLSRMRRLVAAGRWKEAVKVRGFYFGADVENLRAEIYEQHGDFRRAGIAWRAAGNLDRARAAFVKAGDEANVNRVLAQEAENGGDHAAAARHWQAAGVRRNHLRALALAHEAEGRYAKAAECYAQIGMTAQARRCRTEAILRATPGVQRELFP